MVSKIEKTEIGNRFLIRMRNVSLEELELFINDKKKMDRLSFFNMRQKIEKNDH